MPIIDENVGASAGANGGVNADDVMVNNITEARPLQINNDVINPFFGPRPPTRRGRLERQNGVRPEDDLVNDNNPETAEMMRHG